MQDPMSMGWPQGSPIIDEGVLMPIMDKAVCIWVLSWR